MAIDLFTTRFLLRSLEVMKRPLTFLTTMFGGEENKFVTEEVDIHVKIGKRRLAPFVRRTDEAVLVEDIGHTVRKYKPAYVKEKTVTDAGKLLKTPFGSHPYATMPAPNTRAAKKLADDTIMLWDMILRQIERMWAETLRTGQVSIVGETVNETVDYLMPAAHIITLAGADLWSASTSDPISDIRDWKQLVRQATGLKLNKAVMGNDVYKSFINHAGVQAILDNRRIFNVAEINRMQDLDNGAEWVCKVEGVDFYVYDEWYDDGTGTEYPMVPDDRILLGASGARTSQLFGAIEDDESLVPVSYFLKSWKEPDPGRRFLKMESAPLPGFHQPDAFVSVKAV